MKMPKKGTKPENEEGPGVRLKSTQMVDFKPLDQSTTG